METIELNVEPRQQTGKGAARKLRRDGGVPATLYGRKRAAVAVVINAKEFETRVGALEGSSHLLSLRSQQEDINGRLALVKDLQRHPVSRSLVHADFYEVDMATKLRIRVPLHFVGRAQGVEFGGVLQPIRREVEVLCLPNDIPEFLEVDVSPLGLHDAIHMSQLAPPQGVEIPYDSDEAVVSVLPPVVEEVKVAGAEAAAGAPAESAAGAEAQKAETPKGAS